MKSRPQHAGLKRLSALGAGWMIVDDGEGVLKPTDGLKRLSALGAGWIWTDSEAVDKISWQSQTPFGFGGGLDNML